MVHELEKVRLGFFKLGGGVLLFYFIFLFKQRNSIALTVLELIL